MERSVFERHFREAAIIARDFAREFIEETLPDRLLYRVHLNSSNDRYATAEFKLFPEDSSNERSISTKGLDANAVVDVLWRDGWVPQWIDLVVVGESGSATIMDVVACGRFIDDESKLYYTWTDVPPFGPKGPSLPVGWVEGQRFSIYDRSRCWSRDDLERVRKNASKVWSLALHGPAFDDAALREGLWFPKLEVLELYGAPLDGSAFGVLEGVPRLRFLRAYLGETRTQSLRVDRLPRIDGLESLVLYGLPKRVTGLGRFVTAFPGLKELTLGAFDPIESDDVLAPEALEQLTLHLRRAPHWLTMPRRLRSATLGFSEASDLEVTELLARCPPELESLSLRGTPVSNAVLEELERFASLRFVDAVDTRITPEQLHRFAEGRAGLKCLPGRDDDAVNGA